MPSCISIVVATNELIQKLRDRQIKTMLIALDLMLESFNYFLQSLLFFGLLIISL